MSSTDFMTMQKSPALRTVLAALLIGAAVAFAGAGASIADDGGCPNENSGNGEGHADDGSAHGAEKQDDRGCGPGTTESDPTPTPASEPAPAPTAEPTASPAPTPSPDPTPTPTAEPTAAPTATPEPTPSPEPTLPPPTDVPTPIPTPPPGADVQVVDVTVNSPAGASPGVQFVVTGGANIRNNGPVTPVIVDTTFTPALPPGCTATTGVMTVQNTTLPAMVSVFVSRSWMVTCAEPGIYTFTMNVSIAIDASQVIVDPNLGNNLMSGSDTTNVN